MKILILFDSLYGNTEKIARAVTRGFGTRPVAIKSINEAEQAELSSYDLVVFGSPVHGGRATEGMNNLLQRLSSSELKGRRIAVFDTRIPADTAGRFLRFVMRTLGYAAPRMAKQLQSKGAVLAGSPEGFFVEGKEGPLRKGEEERAGVWAKTLIS